jgi:hypothetical protein
MNEVAHQKLIRDKMQKEDAWNLFGEWWKDVDTDIKKAVVKPINFITASNLIKKYEWLGCMPAMVKYCYGIYFDGNLGACVHWAHPHSASKLITSSMKLLPSQYKIVTATVDEHAGEIGTIYQACNFTYIGSMRDNNPKVNSRKNDRFGVKVKGKLYGARSIRQKIGTQKKEEILKYFPDAEFVPQASKKRYFYFLGTKTERKYHKKQIENQIKPYPKRNLK